MNITHSTDALQVFYSIQSFVEAVKGHFGCEVLLASRLF